MNPDLLSCLKEIVRASKRNPRAHEGTGREGRSRSRRKQSPRGEGKSCKVPVSPKIRLQLEDIKEYGFVLPIHRSVNGGPRIPLMRAQGLSESEIQDKIYEWMFTPINHSMKRLNEYAKSIGDRGHQNKSWRLVNNLTPEQRRKAESIFNYMLVKHARSLLLHPKRRKMYWACAVSRVRSRVRYQKQSRNTRSKFYKEGCRPRVTDPVKLLEAENARANARLHYQFDKAQSQGAM